MQPESLRSVLEREHRHIDAAIQPVLASSTVGVEQRSALLRAIVALRRHIYAEEELLFPALRNNGMVGPILVMLREHAQMWGTLDALELRLDADDDSEVPALCGALFTQLQAHNPKEEAILYPQADSMLDAGELSHLRAFLDAGELPSGWACQHLQV